MAKRNFGLHGNISVPELNELFIKATCHYIFPSAIHFVFVDGRGDNRVLKEKM